MPKKNMTDEEKKAWAEKMRQAREKKQNETTQKETTQEDVAQDQSVTDLQRQIQEMKENMDIMRQLLANKGNEVQINKQGDMIGEWEKYLVDPINYPDPTPRLRKEPRLQPLAFDYNYELEYEVGRSSYETKTGKNVVEPRFKITLNRIVLDDQGNQTDKRYIARRIIFHEDPQAALVIARENNLDVDKSDERMFLNEMRYYRVRDWLFDIFWPKPADEKGKIREEVIGGTIVQVFTKSSEDASSIPFNELDTKIRA